MKIADEHRVDGRVEMGFEMRIRNRGEMGFEMRIRNKGGTSIELDYERRFGTKVRTGIENRGGGTRMRPRVQSMVGKSIAAGVEVGKKPEKKSAMEWKKVASKAERKEVEKAETLFV